MKMTMEELSVHIAVLEREVAKLHLQVEKLMTTDESRSSDGFDFHLSSLSNQLTV